MAESSGLHFQNSACSKSYHGYGCMILCLLMNEGRTDEVVSAKEMWFRRYQKHLLSMKRWNGSLSKPNRVALLTIVLSEGWILGTHLPWSLKEIFSIFWLEKKPDRFTPAQHLDPPLVMTVEDDLYRTNAHVHSEGFF